MEQKSLQQTRQEHTGKLSDKWELYVAEYERLLSPYRGLPVKLLEIGIQNGGSLDIWSKYFPQARKFVGCDINPKCNLLRYDDPRIAVVVGDANSDAVQTKVLSHSQTFDIAIDDGSHRSSDIVKSFCRYFPHLADGGIFIAEDLHCSYWREYEGGLLYRYSSIEFFKRLVDVVSHEHWGNGKPRTDVLMPIFSKYKVALDESALQHIHSVEFINSICVIRKAPPQQNKLGIRVIVGSEEDVVAGLSNLNSVESKALPQKRRRLFTK
ncbi:MAG: class I SAM-dependent methyltransferase [Acidobacteriota bacterium]